MLFISDMSRRRVSNPEDDRLKPGRQTVTFLLITNITLWLVYTFEMQKVESNPVQVRPHSFNLSHIARVCVGYCPLWAMVKASCCFVRARVNVENKNGRAKSNDIPIV